MKKKLLSVVLVLCLIVSMAAPVSAAETQTYKIGISIYNQSDNFMQRYTDALVKHFQTLETDDTHFELTILYAENNISTQMDHMKYFIANDMELGIKTIIKGNIEYWR